MAKAELRRTVDTKLLTLYGIGNIVGAGVYVLVGKIAEPAGYLSILAFLIAALVAFCSALSYAELASRFPVSAGAAVYMHEAFRAKRLSTVVGIFLVLAGIISAATLIKGFTGYFATFVDLSPPLIMAGLSAVLLLVMLRGIKESVTVAALFTIIEVAGLIFLVGSILFFEPNAVSNFAGHFTADLSALNMAAISGIMSAAFIAFYAFVGFEDMVNIAEEVKQPQKAFPRAILISMLFVTVLYIAVATVTLGVLSPDILGQSKAPLADAYQAATGNNTATIVVVSLIATLNGILANVIMGSRFLYGMSKRSWLPAWFSPLSRRHVPARSIMIVCVLALGCAIWLPIEHLAQLTSLLLLFVFLAINISLIVIRKRTIGKSLPISPSWMPWVGTIATLGLLGTQSLRML